MHIRKIYAVIAQRNSNGNGEGTALGAGVVVIVVTVDTGGSWAGDLGRGLVVEKSLRKTDFKVLQQMRLVHNMWNTEKLLHPSFSVQFTQKIGAPSVVDPLHLAVWEMRGASVVGTRTDVLPHPLLRFHH
jgi:hypothetical protein